VERFKNRSGKKNHFKIEGKIEKLLGPQDTVCLIDRIKATNFEDATYIGLGECTIRVVGPRSNAGICLCTVYNYENEGGK